jgi:hypothetical protein
VLARAGVLALAGMACAVLAQVGTGQASAAGPSTAPDVTLDPTNVAVAAGQTAMFFARATGSPAPGVLWQVQTPTSKNFVTIAGAVQPTLNVPSVTTAMNGSQYRADFKNSAGSTYSATAVLSVLPDAAPTIQLQPASEARPIGAAATFTAQATGTPAPTVKWLNKPLGATHFTVISGATSSTLVVKGLTAAINGTQYQAIFTNSAGSAGTAVVTLTVAPIGQLVLSPANAFAAVGVHQSYTAHAFDGHGGDLGDVTPGTAFRIGPVGSCATGACWSTTTGGHTVTGTMGSASATASLTVNPVSRLAVTPSSASVGPNVPQTFQAEGFDAANHDLGNVTATTTFALAPNGTCSGAACSAPFAGSHQVTAKDGSASGLANLSVVPLASLVISPAVGAVPPNFKQSYLAEGFDATGNDLGDVTAWTTFAISPEGACKGSSCQATALGQHTVTGTDGAVSGNARMTVTKKFVELLFSRTEITAADGAACLPDDAGVARLDTVIEPYLRHIGLAPTGSIETGPTIANALWCAHNGETLATSWAVAQRLATNGWTFVTHSFSYPAAQDWASMSPSQKWDETCGAAQTIDANGLRGASDSYLWPNNIVENDTLTSFVEPCFGTNRLYGFGETSASEIATAPYRQSVEGLSGGPCIATNAPCHNIPNSVTTYTNPNQIVYQIKALPVGEVLTLQVYLLVTGKSPAYTTNLARWDCTSPDVTLHWTNDAERFCWSDLQVILQYLANAGIGIVQPGVLNATFGRTGYSDHAVTRPPATATSAN